MTTTKLIWRGPREDLEQLSTALTEVLFPPADAVSLIKDDSTESDANSTWQLHGYFEDAPETTSLETALAEMGLSLETPILENLPDVDWVAHSLEGLGVVTAGKFVLFGSHDAEKAKDVDGLKLQIEANRAFGTGHHPTTAGCLEALTRLENRQPEKVLDVGTGSGVLAIAARKLWPQAAIFGTDIDEPSIPIAEENAATNHAPHIHFQVADGLGGIAASDGPFPMVLANILAEPLMFLAPQIAAALAKDGRVVLAGLLSRQEENVLSAYTQAGLCLVDRVEHDTWPVLILAHTNG